MGAAESGEPGDVIPADATDVEPDEIETLEGDLEDAGQPGMLRAVRMLHHGPMPSEQWLTTVEQLAPGSTERIVADFVAEREHQRTIQSAAVEIDKENLHGFRRYQNRQLLAAWSLVVLIAAGGITLILLGQHIEGLIALLGELVTLAGVFLGRQVIQSRR